MIKYVATAEIKDAVAGHETQILDALGGGPMTVSEVYVPNSIKRKRRTKDRMEEIREGIIDILAEHSPMTVRQVFYALTVRRLIEKSEAEYNRKVVRLLTEMRWDGSVDWDDISDASRWLHKPRSYSGAEDAIRRVARFYRHDLWANADDYVEIWCEKEALAGVIAEETYEFDAPLMVSRGFSSGSYLRQAAQHITEIGKPTFVYQVGDRDPSGLWITEQIRRDLQRHIEDIGELHLDEFCFERIAVTPKQIAEWNLPTRPTKREGNRHAHNFEGDSVELDAIPIPQLRELIRDCIQQHIDPHQLRILRAAEASERDLLNGLAGIAA